MQLDVKRCSSSMSSQQAEVYLPKKKIKVRADHLFNKALMKPLVLNKHKKEHQMEIDSIMDALKTCNSLDEAYDVVYGKIGASQLQNKAETAKK